MYILSLQNPKLKSSLKMNLKSSFLVTFFSLFFFSLEAFSHDGDLHDVGDNVQGASLNIISYKTAIDENKNNIFGLHFLIQSGWKTYWRFAGDAGYGVEVDWSRSKNVQSLEIAWPAPSRYFSYDLETIGYENEVVLPFYVSPKDDRADLVIDLDVDYLVCKDVCIPKSETINFTLPVGRPQMTKDSNLIDQYLSKVPRSEEFTNIQVSSVKFYDDESKRLVIRAISDETFIDPDVFLEFSSDFNSGPPKVSLENKYLSEYEFNLDESFNDITSHLPLVVTLVDGRRALEKRINFVETISSYPGEINIITILLFSLLGGLILNLMPCVFPVLSLKAIGLLQLGSSGRTIRKNFFNTAIGIWFSFFILAILVAALRSFGYMVGWGFQFQHPSFLVSMSAVLLIFCCNFWGLFQFSMPSFLQRINTNIFSLKNRNYQNSFSYNFFSGSLLTLLATPCTAPFVGTATGFALTTGIKEIFLVFLVLGFGFSLPYLALSSFPKAVYFLPKPGRWINTVKIFLGLLLFVTVVWLLSILSSQVSTKDIIVTSSLLFCIFLFFLAKKFDYFFDSLKKHSSAIFVLIILTIFSYGITVVPEKIKDKDILWKPFNESEIIDLVNAGNVVLVNVTADWCITCKVNKNLVLDRGPVFELLSSNKIIGQEADWTLPSLTITEYLSKFQRSGIPFNVIYGPRSPNGIVLPEILTQNSILSAVDKVSN